MLIVLLVPFAFARCSCDESLTMLNDPPIEEEDAEPSVRLDAGLPVMPDPIHADAATPDAGSALDADPEDAPTYPDAEAPDAEEPPPDAGLEISDLCQVLQRQTLQQTFNFPDLSPCPWGQGDNLPIDMAIGWSARTEQVAAITGFPENAVVCDARFEVPQQAMYFDDAMLIAVADVILMTDVNVSVFADDGRFYYWDWMRMRGSRGSALYCLGAATGEGSCTLPAMETPGTMSLEISSNLAQAIGQHARQQSAFEVRVLTFGDNDPYDCRHEPFDFVVSLDYVVP